MMEKVKIIFKMELLLETINLPFQPEVYLLFGSLLTEFTSIYLEEFMTIMT